MREVERVMLTIYADQKDFLDRLAGELKRRRRRRGVIINRNTVIRAMISLFETFELERNAIADSEEAIEVILRNYLNSEALEAASGRVKAAQCSDCGEWTSRLIKHHEGYQLDGKEVNKLVRLCRECHIKRHSEPCSPNKPVKYARIK